jgi:hypothetical protein
MAISYNMPLSTTKLNTFFYNKQFLLGQQARLIKNLQVPCGTLVGKECVQKTCRLTTVTGLLHHEGVVGEER